jgi:hypothetical protein
MRLSPCRFHVPLTDNRGQPIDPQVILDLHRDLFALFTGFTIHPTSQGRWRSRAGHVYPEEVVVYEVAVGKDKVPILREMVCQVGRRLQQLAMYFDAPPPSVEIIDLSSPAGPAATTGGSSDEPGQRQATRRRGKKDRPSS